MGRFDASDREERIKYIADFELWVRRDAYLRDARETARRAIKLPGELMSWRLLLCCIEYGRNALIGIGFRRNRECVPDPCSQRVIVLDTGHDGQLAGSIATGAWVDTIDYTEDTGPLYVAAAEAAQLTVARVNDKGMPTLVEQVPTTKAHGP